MSDAFFRAGVGAVILDASNRILSLRRKGVADSAWQLPQGGIRFDEQPVEALHREVHEEVGLETTHYEIVATTRDWLAYELPPGLRNAKVGWGQVQRWYLCRLHLMGSTAARPDHVEVDDLAWYSVQQLLERVVDFRVPLYRRVVAEFKL